MSLSKVIWTYNGFEDLKKYTHKNNDFIRDVALLLQERAKLEQTFADGLMKIASKARKIYGETIGTLRQSWEDFSSCTEQESNLHKNLSHDLSEDIVKPMRIFADQQKEQRKPAEHAVEKALKSFTEKRSKESQAKKLAFYKAKEAETLTLQLENAREKTISDKDLSKLDSKCKKAEESVNKADDDYIDKLLEAERARLNLDSNIIASTLIFQKIEEERIDQFKKFLSSYSNLLMQNTPKFDEVYKSLEGNVSRVNVNADIETLVQTRGSTREPGEQILFACFEEDSTNTMDERRRVSALERKSKKLEQQLLAERKARKGLSRLNSVYSDNPSFSNETTQQDVGFQLTHADSVINLIEVSIFRLNDAMSQFDGHYQTQTHRLSQYIDKRKDKQGITHATLRAPVDGSDDNATYMPPSSYAESEYSTSNAAYQSNVYEDDSDFEGMSNDVDYDDYEDYEAVDRCVADYEYKASENDELSILPGDTITVLLRHDDGWWKGELNGKVGLFPSAYVHEI